MLIYWLLNLQMAVCLVIVTTGLVVRGRAAYCRCFLAYAVVTCATIVHWLAFPEVFWDYSLYSMKETVLVVLVALEVWQRSFASFPRARMQVGWLVALALLLTAMAGLMIPAGLYPYDVLVGVVHPRQQAGTLILYAVIVAGASWHRVPLHPLHRAILGGFAFYLPITVFAHSFIGSQDGSMWAYT